jgi:FKBP-type peptidyl-prolyl cis-trans isomerase 2
MAALGLLGSIMVRALRQDEDGVSTLWSFVGVLILVIAILGVYYGYVVPKFAAPPLRAQSGDHVQVDYIGTFLDTGLVFDTSLQSVAIDNASYPKAFMFNWHSWQALPVTIGTGGVVKGFDLGIQGLAVGDSKAIVVPPSLGYGPVDPTKLVTKTLFESVPVRLTMSTSDFVATYRASPVSGMNVTDPFWGWAQTVSVAGSVVVVTNSPVPGQVVHPYGAWDAEVVSIDDAANGGQGVILVHHRLDPTMVDRIGERSGGNVVFVVTSVDLVAGTYTLDFDTPTKGRTLVFQVTMVQINRPV